jgi:regulatory protein
VKISKITPQKKNRKRSTIYIDGKYAFGLSNEIVAKFDLHEGNELDDDLVRDVLLAQEKQKIRERAFRILHYRIRSVQEMKTRLLGIGFDETMVNETLNEFIKDNTLNDKRFAEAFLADYTNLKPKGNIFINRELRKKGVSPKVIQDLMHNRDEKRLAMDFLKKKLHHFDLNKPKDRQKVLRRMLARGFTPSVVYDVLSKNEE